ncbi:MAG TPA: hypothetical protein VJ625_13200 [Propionibacteriaceae bacterium]|nr:hypothetical protein [Propionibacteriaceae bacterium]
MSMRDALRRSLGLPEGATDDQIANAIMARRSVATATPTADQTMRWSMSIDPSAVQPSTITLSEAQTELRDLFKRITEPNPNGMSFAEIEQREQSCAKYPHLYDAYRRMVTQTG